MRQLLLKILAICFVIQYIIANSLWKDIRVYFDTFEIARKFPDSINVINDAAQQTSDFVKEFIKVKPGNSISFPEDTGCGDLTAFPQSLRGKTFTDYDLMVIVYGSYSDKFGTRLTRGSQCPAPTLNPLDSRPLIAKISINPKFLSLEPEVKAMDQSFYYSFLQATFQAMAFTKQHLSYFLRPEKYGGGYWPLEDTFGIDKIAPYLKLPTMLTSIKKHFSCLNLEYFYLENEMIVDERNPQIYWEARYLQPDLMVANFTRNPKISKITASFLKSTGWYQVDDALDAKINWGKNAGCNFQTSVCDTSFQEFNNATKQNLCSSEFDMKGSTFTSSSDEYFDGCKIFRPIWPNDTINDGDCTNPHRSWGNQTIYDEIDETWGSDSRCFIASYQKYVKYPGNPELIFTQAECHRVNCEINDAGLWVLNVYFSNQVIQCPPEGGYKTLGIDIKGKIYCPVAADVCRTFENNVCPQNCSSRGRCKQGSCVCFPGWKGELCQTGLRGLNSCIYPIDGDDCESKIGGCFYKCPKKGSEVVIEDE